MSGPAKLNENTKIQRRAPLLTDDFFFASNGFGGVSNISALLGLLNNVTPIRNFTDIDDLLANTDIGLNYFAYVANAEDDIGRADYALYVYVGPTRDDIDSYTLVAKNWTIEEVLLFDNDAGTLLLKNLGNGVDPADAINLSQLNAAIAALVQHYRGTYISSAALTSAHPSATPGDYAYVDAGVGNDAQIWIWDNDDAAWKQGGSAPVPDATSSIKGIMKLYTSTGTDTDGTMTRLAITNAITAATAAAWSTTVAGLVELSTTAEAQNIITRALAGSSNASNSDARTPSEKGLVEMILSFIAAAWTWTSQQTFSIGPIISDATAGTIAFFHSSTKKLITIAYAALSDFITGTDNTKPVTVSAILAWTQYARTSVSVSAGTMTLNLAGARIKRFYVTTANVISSNFTLAFSNESDFELMELDICITGNVVMTVPSTVYAGNDQKVAAKWDNGSPRKFTFAGGTATYFTVIFKRIDTSVISMRVDPDYLV